MRSIAFFLFPALLAAAAPSENKPIKLPAPKMGSATLDSALKNRQSARALTGPALSLAELSQLLWSAQGENRPGTGRRTVPSATARYPLELYVLVEKSDQLGEGLYKYSFKEHSMTKIKDGSPQTFFSKISSVQPWIPKAPAIFIFSGVESRMRDYDNNYPNAKELYTFWESGAAAQSLCLQVAALNLGATVVLSANLPTIRITAGLPEEERISVIVPVGRVGN
jgi:SagB-type dehydrogenase family enzyme